MAEKSVIPVVLFLDFGFEEPMFCTPESRGFLYFGGCCSGKKKAHKQRLFCPVGLGTNPGFLLILHSGSLANPGLSLGQTQFVPGTISGTKGGTESLCEKSLCAFFAREL